MKRGRVVPKKFRKALERDQWSVHKRTASPDYARRLEPRLWPSGLTLDEALAQRRPCPWTGRPIKRHPRVGPYPDSYRYDDTGKHCPPRVAHAAGFRSLLDGEHIQ